MALRAVPEHPKFARLKKSLGISKFEALGLLEALWHFTGKFAPRGNVGKFSNEEIESWLEWNGEPGTAVMALIAAGWLDENPQFRLAVHDWKDHADATTKKYMGRTREGFVQDMSGQVEDMSGRNGKSSGPPVPVPVPVPEPVPEPEPNTLASTAIAVPAARGKLVCTLPLNQGEHEVFADDVQQWEALYPAVDVRQELRTIKGWALSNPTRRKTKSGIARFVNSWLARSQNNSHSSGGGNGTFKGKSGHSVSEAKGVIQEIEDSYASGDAWDSEAGEIGQGRLPSVCE